MTIERREYTATEVAYNDGSNGRRVWIIVQGVVYDVTDYLEQHPGGGELIAEYAGMDATEGFEDFGHSSDAKRTLKKYEIGVLVKSSNENGNRNGNSKEINNHVNGKRTQRRVRRKFLSTILGPCATKL